MAERSKLKTLNAKAKLCVKYKNSKYFDAKLRFALLPWLRSAISRELRLDN
jgi:hypothetical protein